VSSPSCSHNDQVSTDLRLRVRNAIDRVDAGLLGLQRAFVGRCAADADVILPAYTHRQRAQPVLASHYWLAYCEKSERDRQRLADGRKRVNVCTWWQEKVGCGPSCQSGFTL
jgi:argininosuccinate lyase